MLNLNGRQENKELGMGRDIICGIYKITNPIGHIYIGQSIDCNFRKNYYKRPQTCQGQIRLYRSIIKYGWDNHSFEIIHICKENELNKWEIFYIKKFDSFETPHGMNLTTGGSNGRLSEETKRKQSISALGKKKSPEHIEKVRKANIGKKYSKEINAKKGRSNVLQTEEKRRKCRESKLGVLNPMYGGKRHTKEWREKVSASQKKIGNKPPIMYGKDNPQFGKVRSPEHCQKLRIGQLKYLEKKRNNML